MARMGRRARNWRSAALKVLVIGRVPEPPGTGETHMPLRVLGGSADNNQAVLWWATGPDSWEGRLPVPGTAFELLLTVRPGDGGRYLAQIAQVDSTGAASPEVLLRFYDELLPFLLFE